MPEPTITASPDGSTISWTCTREQAIAIAVATQDRKIEQAEPVLRALIGSPAWKQQTGEGTPGPLSQAEVEELRLTTNYPVIPQSFSPLSGNILACRGSAPSLAFAARLSRSRSPAISSSL